MPIGVFLFHESFNTFFWCFSLDSHYITLSFSQSLCPQTEQLISYLFPHICLRTHQSYLSFLPHIYRFHWISLSHQRGRNSTTRWVTVSVRSVKFDDPLRQRAMVSVHSVLFDDFVMKVSYS